MCVNVGKKWQMCECYIYTNTSTFPHTRNISRYETSFRHLLKSSRMIFYILSSVTIAVRALSGVETKSKRNILTI